FLNPDRISPPDIDVDFCEARRGEVLEYVRRKYGERRVAQIITFGKLKAKSVVRDVGRVMGLPYAAADRIAKMIPNELNITLDSAAEKNAELKRAIATEKETKQLFEYGKILEGLSRNAGVHAAGVVIADRDLTEYIPLCRDVKGNDVISQYPMGPLNDLGLLKMDFLGLKTLTVIEDTLALIHKRDPDFSLENIPLDDPATFALYNRGETIGLFQMESGGMTSLSKQLDVKKLDDIIALIALYRPGPMELIPEFVKAKKGITPIKYLHPLLEEICADTYGVVSYHTAYLKAHYPVEFMAGLLSNEINNTEKISVFVGECKRMGISILPPDINRSGLKFIPESQNGKMSIRYGLAAIKHVGESAMEMSIQERERGGEFASLEDFCGRLGTRVANRKMLESLIKVGAFDFLGRDRAELFACIDQALASSAAAHRDRTAGQVSLFDEAITATTSTRKRSIAPWSDHEKLSYEKELLGFYVSGHPLDAYIDLFAAKNYQPIASLGELDDRSQFKTAGAIVQFDKKFTRKEGKPFAVIWMEDLSGTIEVVIWNDVYVKVSDALALGRVVEIQGAVDTRGDSVRATAQKVKVLGAEKTNRAASANERSTNAFEEPVVLLQFSPATTNEELREVRKILASSPGQRRVQLLFDRPTGNSLRVDAGPDLRVNLTGDLEEKLSRWLVSTKVERRNVMVDPAKS
ncbi:MAG: DNA polymerase III subunit alpha, partial [Verrucomicrobia bacterium]